MNPKTTVLRGADVKRQWHLIDLSGQTLGRVATAISHLLIGKNKATFSYHRDDGDYVVAINASQIKVTGKKNNQKLYQSYSGYPGGLKELKFSEMMTRDPRQVILHAVYGMIPKNRLRDSRLSRLKVFSDANHTFADKLSSKK